MVSTGKAVNFILRFLQVASAAVAAGILADYVSIVNHTDVGPGSRIVYALSITSISIFFALVLLYPSSKYYYSFPLDLCLGICLIVAAGLLTAVSLFEHRGLKSLTYHSQLTGSAGCNSRWYVTHWGWAWGGWWRRVPAQRIVASQVDGAGCGSWKASVGLCYIAGFWWLGSFVLVSNMHLT